MEERTMPTDTPLTRDENAPELDSATPKLSRREQLEQWLEQRGKSRVVTHNAHNTTDASRTAMLSSRISRLTAPASASDVLATPSRTASLASRVSQLQSPASNLARRLEQLKLPTSKVGRDLGPAIETLLRTPMPSLYSTTYSQSPVRAGVANLVATPEKAADSHVDAPSSPAPLRLAAAQAAPAATAPLVPAPVNAPEADAAAPLSAPSEPARAIEIAAPELPLPAVATVPRRKVPANTVVQYVDGDGSVLWSEVIEPTAAPLLSLQDGAALAKRGAADAARAVFVSLEPYESGKALYWITRAKFEEDSGNGSQVLDLYNRAIRAGAEPSTDIHAAIRWFLMRTQRARLASPECERVAPHGLDLTARAGAAGGAAAPQTPQRLVAAGGHGAGVLQALSQLSPGLDTHADEESVLVAGSVSPCPSPELRGLARIEASPFVSDGRRNRVPNRSPRHQRMQVSTDADKSGQLVHTVFQALRALRPDTMPPLKEEQLGSSFGIMEAVPATRKQRQELGVDVLLTPVRRSLRNAGKSKSKQPIDALLEGAGYAYTPNRAFVGVAAPSSGTPRPQLTRPALVDGVPALSFSLDATDGDEAEKDAVAEPQHAAPKEGPQEAAAATSRVKFAAVTPSKKMRDMLGADVIITPVRRSARQATKRAANLHESYLSVESLDEIPQDVQYAYLPNASVNSMRDNAPTTPFRGSSSRKDAQH